MVEGRMGGSCIGPRVDEFRKPEIVCSIRCKFSITTYFQPWYFDYPDQHVAELVYSGIRKYLGVNKIPKLVSRTMGHRRQTRRPRKTKTYAIDPKSTRDGVRNR